VKNYEFFVNNYLSRVLSAKKWAQKQQKTARKCEKIKEAVLRAVYL
jgi:hypothetical protein